MVLGFVLYLGSGLTSSSAYLSNPAFQSGGLTYYAALPTPQGHVFDGYMKLALNGGGLANILPNILALFGFGVVFFLVGLWRFKKEWLALTGSNRAEPPRCEVHKTEEALPVVARQFAQQTTAKRHSPHSDNEPACLSPLLGVQCIRQPRAFDARAACTQPGTVLVHGEAGDGRYVR